jgi:nucleotide-binding universal stress UspA family protein
MLRKIMFPTDFSLASNNILECIPTFKDFGLKEAVIVHIVDSRDDRDHVQRTDWAKNALDEYKKKFDGCGVEIKTIVLTGVPFIELTNVAEEEGVSLVIITSHGKSMIEKMLLGSVTEKFVYHGKKPVLVEKVRIFEDCISEEHCNAICKNTFKHILFPTDWSGCADDVLDEIEKFNEYGTEEITVIHVMDERLLIGHYSEEEKEEHEKADVARLNKVKERLEGSGYKVNTLLSKGAPFKEIERAARESEITLITMGVHGKGFVKEALLGSTAERVIKFAYKPMLLLSHNEN